MKNEHDKGFGEKEKETVTISCQDIINLEGLSWSTSHLAIKCLGYLKLEQTQDKHGNL